MIELLRSNRSKIENNIADRKSINELTDDEDKQ